MWKIVDENVKPSIPVKKVEYSQYQQDIFTYIENSMSKSDKQHLMIQAVAGSGKTFTGVEAFKRLPSNLNAAFVAFNTHIASELKEKLPSSANARTYHSLGLEVLRKNISSKMYVNDNKTSNFLYKKLSNNDRWMTSSICKLTSLCKNHPKIHYTDDELRVIAFMYDVNLYDEFNNQIADKIFALTRESLEYAVENSSYVDYADMVWLPNVLNDGMLNFPAFDFLAVDEVQDTNSVQMQLAIRCINNNGMIVGIGDSYQSIYAWRGADITAMETMKNEINAMELPLSISYRCPKAVQELVNTEFPHIKFESAKNAIPGKIESVNKTFIEKNIQPDDMVLCRVNADLVPLAFSLIRNGVKATIKGRDIGKGLVTLIKQSKANSVKDLFNWLEKWKTSEFEKSSKYYAKAKIQMVQDKYDTILALSDGVNGISEIITKCETLFSDEKNGVMLSSIHRAKGLEADRVWILRPDLLPHPLAKGEDQKQQEDNLKYVAITRTKNELYFVS